ncbi:MAG: two-component system sensor histidine kinase CreC [Verrucomicrobiales bacterium]
MSLSARLLFGFVVIAAGGFYFLSDQIVQRVERQYIEAVEEPMVDAANILAASLEQDIKDGRLDVGRFATAFDSAKRREFEARIYTLDKSTLYLDAYVTDAKGIVLFDSMNPAAIGADRYGMRDVRLTLNGRYGARSSRTDEADDTSSIMYVGAPVRHQGQIIGMVSVAKPQRAIFHFRDETRRWLRGHITLIIAAMVLASYLLARWAARPVERLTEHARAITRGERPPTPRLAGRDMRTLGDAFEKMREELEGREYVENYIQTLTHELKSPVAAIQGASELLAENPPPEQRAKFLANIATETRRLHDLIDRLLELAALEKRKTLDDARPVDLTALAATVIDRLAPVLQQRGLSMDSELTTPLPVRGDAFLLEVAIMNLLQNAIDFSPAGATIGVRVEREGAFVRCVITDDGPGVPDYARDKIFDRFYSLPRPQSGYKSSGLGLCFVREIASLHGGIVTLKNRSESGAQAVLELPAVTGDPARR